MIAHTDCAILLLSFGVLVLSAVNATSEALNKTNTNLVSNFNAFANIEGPVLYYNGTGPVPAYDVISPVPPPITPINSNSILETLFFNELYAVANTTTFSDDCSKCIAGAEVLHLAAITLPVNNFVNVLIKMFVEYIYADTCAGEYGATQGGSDPYSSGGGATGAYLAQLFSKMTIATGDMAYFCYFNWEVCPRPATIGIQESLYFSPKSANASTVPAPSGTIELCQQATLSDVVQVSREYAEYEETVTYQTFKAQLGNIPVYATLGNHDTIPVDWNTENSLDAGISTTSSANALGWNYDLLSSLWENAGWVTGSEEQYASTHYGAYAHTTRQGLRILSINTDFWYTGNVFNYWNVTNPDTSGILSWLAKELAACEARGQRAWIIGHVPSGYDGANALLNPSALFYSIVVRFSPATIAGVFFGHTHEDQIQIFYDFLPNSTYKLNGKTYRNTTMVDYSRPLNVGYIGASITPLSGNNAGYQLYQVDAATFSVTGIQTYFANISESLTWTIPEWRFEYDAREVYSAAASSNGTTWPSNAPLNAMFWDGVTKSMLKNQTLVELYNLYETKSSVVTGECSTAACARQKVCYIRSGSAALGLACGDKNGPF
ncbi:hypothetical protein H2200_013078 [Cladophialophora chaetospira]|uniref:Calcineurin-like phosphoesterase domain-containing protein n=1 Tax=Cladophialophora chaetospira TaxID=386627 RepID=A0AA38WWR0_9EURO|nr:hypothetical protein H2200_013078 [Cladophialophora chaetospira]